MIETTRRGFLGSLVTALAGAALIDIDPERLLWTPGEKTIFLPAGDIAIKNIRPATLAEQGAITGERMLRIRHFGAGLSDHFLNRVENIALMSEKAFILTGRAAFADSPFIDVHFDDGLIAHGVKASDNYPAIRAKAEAAKRVNDEKLAAQARVMGSRVSRGYDIWREALPRQDSAPVIRLPRRRGRGGM